MKLKKNKKAVEIGMKSGFLSSLCCITPMFLVLLLMLFGIGSTSLLIGSLALSNYKIWFILAGLVFMASSIYLYIKRENKGVCNINTIKNNKAVIAISLAVYLLIFFSILYVLLPLILRLI